MAAKVLLVEDDNNLREIYEARLQAEGYAIVSARDGEEALVVAKAERPDLIVSDVMMPKISGFEMLDILRNTDGLKDTKVIMLTALGQTDDKTRADSLGADRYLVKSQVTLEDIVKAAHELLGDSTTEAAPAPEAVAAAEAAPTPTPDLTPAPTETVATEPAAAPANPIEVAAAPTVPTAPAEPTVSPVEPPSPPAPTAPVEPVASATPITPTPPPEAAPAAAPVATTEATSSTTFEPTTASAPAVTPSTDDTSATSLDTSRTTAEEQATMASQIESFVSQADADTPPASAEPAPTAPDLASDTTTSEHDTVMADAIDDLAQSTTPHLSSEVTAIEVPPATSVAPANTVVEPTTAPAPAVTPTNDDDNDSVTVAHKKVIRPLDATDSKPDLNALLAAEEAKNIMTNQVPTTPQVTPGVTAQPGGTVAPSNGGTPPAPKGPNDFDPNNIAL